MNNSTPQSLHPLQMLLPELRVRGRCAERSLLPLEHDAVAAYLGQRFPPHSLSAEFIQTLTQLSAARVGIGD